LSHPLLATTLTLDTTRHFTIAVYIFLFLVYTMY